METTRYRPGTSMTASSGGSLNSSGASWSNRSPKLVSSATSDVTSTTTSSTTSLARHDHGQGRNSIKGPSDNATAAAVVAPAAAARSEYCEDFAPSSVTCKTVASPRGDDGIAGGASRSSGAASGNKKRFASPPASVPCATATCSNSSAFAATALTAAVLSDDAPNCVSSHAAAGGTSRSPTAVSATMAIRAHAHDNANASGTSGSVAAADGNIEDPAAASPATAAAAIACDNEITSGTSRSTIATSVNRRGSTPISASAAAAFNNSIARLAGIGVAAAGGTSGRATQESSQEQDSSDQILEGGRNACFNELVIDCVDFSSSDSNHAQRTLTPEELRGHYAGQHMWPAPLISDSFQFPPPLLSASPEPADFSLHDASTAQTALAKTFLQTTLASPRAEAATAEAAGATRATGPAAPAAKAPKGMAPDFQTWAAASVEVEEELPQDQTRMERVKQNARVNCEGNCVMVREPCGARCPSFEDLHTAAVQWPSMTFPDRGSLYTPPETRDAAAKIAQDTWDAAHKAATVGPAILAPVQQRRRVSLNEAMRLLPSDEVIARDCHSRSPTLLAQCDGSDQHAGAQQTCTEKDWQASTVMHVRRARVVCQKAQSRLMRIASQDGPVFLRLYDDHLCRMDRMERHRAKVKPLSSSIERHKTSERTVR
mmetsp:Transcript_99664/g.192499  ORF Transcript_99664/g.192499 Transcript_99664/m.192499 type:complete len:660 (-) Transcript_99664:25-2004(-)